MDLRHKRAVVFVCLFGMLLSCSFIFLQPSLAVQNEPEDFLRYDVNNVFVGTIRHLVEIRNPTLQVVPDGRLFIPLIRNETARHYVIISNISSSHGQPVLLNDSFENVYAYWDDVRIDAKQNFSAEIDYIVLSSETRYVINSSLIPNYYRDSDLYDKYTKPEPFVQSDNPEIVSKAYNLTAGLNGILSKVSRVYDFVTTYLRYAIQDEERGALWALMNKTGDCSEYSYLFVALCRALGIPARVEAGFAFRSDTETTEDGHMWAEYCLENYGWVPVDPTWRLFNWMDSRHFGSQQSIPEVIPYSNYAFNTTLDLKLEDKQTVTLKPASQGPFGNGTLIQDMLKAVQKVREARTVLSIGKAFGVSLIFPSDVEEIERSLLRSRVLLQNAIERLDRSDIDGCIEKADEALRIAWISVTKVFALWTGVLLIDVLVVLVFLRRRRMIGESKALEKTDKSVGFVWSSRRLYLLLYIQLELRLLNTGLTWCR